MAKPLKIQTPLGKIYIENGILYADIQSTTIDLAMAKSHMELIQHQAGHLFQIPGVVDSTCVKPISKEVRDYFAKHETSAQTSAAAVILKSTLTRIAGNLFMQFNKPKYPMKFFTDRAKAVEWIREITR